MPRNRPANAPISFHKPTGQYYVTRGGKRAYLGTDRETAMKRYHRLSLGESQLRCTPAVAPISAKELANRFLATQQANWRRPRKTLSAYRDWLGRFLKDHRGLVANDLTVEMFASWKLSLRDRGYSPESINHYLSAVRAMYAFGEETDVLSNVPRLKRVKNESRIVANSRNIALYTAKEIGTLLRHADQQLKAMVLLALNCGFGPKDLHDLRWRFIEREQASLMRSKTGTCQTYRLWPETQVALADLRLYRARLIARLGQRGRSRSDHGHVFVTRYWRTWSCDAIAEQFRKLCRAAGVPCYGIYRLRHCASTAMSLVATPHVHRKFMRHSQLQQQVTYTHTPDEEVDIALMRTREKLLPTVDEKTTVSEDEGSDPQRAGAA